LNELKVEAPPPPLPIPVPRPFPSDALDYIAQRLIEKGVKRVVFDRNGFLYHGRVKAVADAAREAGLEF